MQPKPHVAAIDGLRAFAVLAVLGEHALLNASPGHAAAWMGCGARGVDLFFGISGFCLSYPFLRAQRRIGTLDISYASFFVRRIVRIAPPYLVALVVLAILSLTSFGLPTLLGGGQPSIADRFRDFALDAIFLTDRAPLYNSSFWTLGVEMRWYLVFPLILGLYVRSRAAFFALGCACYALYFLTPWGFAEAGMLPCFMLGIVAADLRIRSHPAERYVGLATIVVLPLAIMSQTHASGVDHGDPLWHIAAFCTIVGSVRHAIARVLAFRPLAFLGVASYSIYLVHLPVLDALHVAHAAPIVSAILALACGLLFYGIVERPSLDDRFREPLEARAGDALRRVFPHTFARVPTYREKQAPAYVAGWGAGRA